MTILIDLTSYAPKFHTPCEEKYLDTATGGFADWVSADFEYENRKEKLTKSINRVSIHKEHNEGN